MTFRSLSLTQRSLREGTRQKTAYAVRALLVLALTFAIILIHEQERFVTFGGPMLLGFVAWGDWILLTLGAVGSFSGLITEEKEQETLGLLRLAGFTPISIILGKSAGTLANVLLLLVVQVPFCVLALAFGGVSPQQIQAVFGVLFAHALFVYGLAILCSVLCARSSRAAVATLVILLVYHAVPPIAVQLILHYGGSSPAGWLDSVGGFFLGWNQTLAVQVLFRATGIFGGFGGVTYAPAVLTNLILGGVLLVAAWIALYLVREESAEAVRPVRGFGRLFAGARVGRRFGRNPIREKDYLLLSGGSNGLVLRASFYAVLLLIIELVDPGASLRNRAETIMGWGIFFLVLELGLQAERVFRTEVQERTWGVLYALPCNLGRIVRSKVLGALVRVIPATLLVVVGALHHPGEFEDWLDDLFSEPIAWFFFWQIVFGLVLTAYFSLGSGRAALVRAVAIHLVFNFVFGLSMSMARPSMNSIDGVCGVLAIGFALGIFPLLAATGERLRERAAD